MDRPKRRDPATLAIAAQTLAEQIVEEWDSKGVVEDWKQALLKNDIIVREDDGYGLARELESNNGIAPDAQLVGLLDQGQIFIDDAHSEAIQKWVKDDQITPDRALGDMVSTQQGVGAIVAIMEKDAIYVVRPPNNPRFTNGGGYLIAYEDCADADAEITT